MRIASLDDRSLLCEILAEAFKTNPSVNWVVGNRKGKQTRINLVVKYSVDKCLREGTALISGNEKGAALYFLPDYSTFSFREIYWQVVLAIRVVGLFRVFEIMKRERFIKSKKRAVSHLYFWYLGVKSDTRDGKAFRELRDYVFELAKENGLPILIETSEPKNIKPYQRIGFKTYFKWEVPKKEMSVWFMQRNVEV